MNPEEFNPNERPGRYVATLSLATSVDGCQTWEHDVRDLGEFGDLEEAQGMAKEEFHKACKATYSQMNDNKNPNDIIDYGGDTNDLRLLDLRQMPDAPARLQSDSEDSSESNKGPVLADNTDEGAVIRPAKRRKHRGDDSGPELMPTLEQVDNMRRERFDEWAACNMTDLDTLGNPGAPPPMPGGFPVPDNPRLLLSSSFSISFHNPSGTNRHIEYRAVVVSVHKVPSTVNAPVSPSRHQA